MSFGDMLNTIIDDLQNYPKSKEEIMIYCINKRLNESLQTYYKELSNSVSYLSERNDKMRVIKSLNKDD